MDFIKSNLNLIIYVIGLIGVYVADHYKIVALEERLDKTEGKYDILDRKIDKLNDSVIRLQTIIEEKLK